MKPLSRQLPPLHTLVFFDAVARLGSLTRAAESLHITQSAVSMQVRALEGGRRPFGRARGVCSDDDFEAEGPAEDPFADGLNAPQAQAVAHSMGPLLVFAGAGSGKTRVITYRIANLVARHDVPPFRILAVTFTNKAAGEMRHRLEGMLGPAARELWVGTFHATCAKILRRYSEGAGLTSSFVIHDAQDQRSVMTRVLRDLELDEKRYPPRAMLARVHKEKQEGRGPDEMSIDSYLDEAAQKAYVAYEARLRAANAVDFEDLIFRVVRILEAKDGAEPAVREAEVHGYDILLYKDIFEDIAEILRW